MDDSEVSCSCDIVQVAIVNKDTLEEKVKQQAILAIATGVCTLLVSQGIPWTVGKLASIKKARDEKAKQTKKD